jgi:hypothetical protein
MTMMADLTVIAPEDLNPQVPTSLNKLVMDCIETNAKKRPSSMNEVASRLSLISVTLKRNS